ncbi:sugar ABC transporter permease [Entomospira culicis]|uniref:Maltose/maltodextrin transport system permease protein MalG n=1 Tax=Entomospira culicis TaxID=2719989 RepID=A0A968GJZ7_9SPIO|nr:sugar ABC transporter permease [Entomospira culicis]NIZ19881.1 sugar ABC transporter permease [Entomospira culicis]NIZ70095.1 sugar ABC transporter permease [Entomospira culicis]WDI37199.1 sugar ABC transporter permease [Entomospira culicis]WDI38828.1 sugar ABC transporter permease [Entomospira culicis]
MINKFKLMKWGGIIVSYAILLFMTILILFPLFITVMSAFNAQNTLFSTKIIPENFTWTGNFKHLNEQTAYWSWYRNTFFTSLASMFGSLIIVTISGFIYSRYRYRTRKPALISLLIIQIIPSGSALIALYAIASSIGIYQSANPVLATYIFMSFVYITGGTTMNSIIMKGYYDSIPRDLDESAKIDGASHIQIFKDILLPLVVPMIIVLGIFSFLAPVGDVIMPNFLLASLHSKDTTLALGLKSLVTDFKNSTPNVFAAGAILAALPPVVLFFVFQKYIVGGLTAGGVKG